MELTPAPSLHVPPVRLPRRLLATCDCTGKVHTRTTVVQRLSTVVIPLEGQLRQGSLLSWLLLSTVLSGNPVVEPEVIVSSIWKLHIPGTCRSQETKGFAAQVMEYLKVCPRINAGSQVETAHQLMRAYVFDKVGLYVHIDIPESGQCFTMAVIGLN